MEVFLVEDDIALSKALQSFFKLKKYEVKPYFDGEEAFNDIKLSNLADIYIIDINLPNISGLELVKQVRKIDVNVPIIVITASIEIEVLENAYSFGCSEYIKKPFDLKELAIRLEKLSSNRITQVININQSIQFDLKNNLLLENSKPVDLRKKELRFLSILFKNHKFIVNTNDIEDYVWEGEIKENYPLRQLVAKLRKKLSCDFIKTEVGIGYYTTDECE